MTINEHVSLLRNIIKAHSDDSDYTDQFLYELLRQARAKILSQRVTKAKKVSNTNWQRICMPLELDTFYDCSCVPSDDCKVLKSRYKIPTYIRNLIRVTTLGGDNISESLSLSDVKRRQYSKILKNKKTWLISGGYLYIFNDNMLKTVLVEAVFEDPSSLAEIDNCDSDGTSTGVACFNMDTSDFPIDDHLAADTRSLIYPELEISLKVQEDEVNDARSNL